MKNLIILFTFVIYIGLTWSQGLVAYYPLNGNATDSSGNGNNGTLNGVSFASSDTRTFAQFSVASYINIPDNSSFDFSNASGVTFATWVRQEQSTLGYILIKMGTSGSSDDEYSLTINETGKLSGAFNSPTTYKVVQSNSSIVLNTWNHIVFMWNKADSKITFYINGVMDTTVSSSVTSIRNTTQPLRIGKPQHNANSFLGSIDDVRIYNRALSIEEVQFLYGLPVGVNIDESITLNDYYLSQNYPNPFNPSTKISWHSAKSGNQSLKVFDILGKEVATLVDEYRSAGDYEINFHPNGLTSGIYFYQLQISNFVQTKKMILLK